MASSEGNRERSWNIFLSARARIHTHTQQATTQLVAGLIPDYPATPSTETPRQDTTLAQPAAARAAQLSSAAAQSHIELSSSELSSSELSSSPKQHWSAASDH
eukprot:Tamp_23399.p2 GENE.Tamp_23399~~Tamp_23399.p2  ORF type:complete len:103 (-),score=17.20 Tamp_23399:329-637(-)